MLSHVSYIGEFFVEERVVNVQLATEFPLRLDVSSCDALVRSKKSIVIPVESLNRGSSECTLVQNAHVAVEARLLKFQRVTIYF